MTKQKDLTTGIWKFAETVELEELIALAEEWAKDDNYLNLYIRKVSKDQNGIGFTYRRADDSQESNDKFFDEITDMLKRRFGNKLVGWDVSARTFTIKGF